MGRSVGNPRQHSRLALPCALAFSDSATEYAGYREYFHARRRWFSGLLALLYAADLLDTWIRGPAYFHSFGTEFVVRNLSRIALRLVAAATRSPWYHGAFVCAGPACRISWIARQFETP